MSDLMMEIATVGGQPGLSPASAPSHRTSRGNREEPSDPSRAGKGGVFRCVAARELQRCFQARRSIAVALPYLSSVSRCAAQVLGNCERTQRFENHASTSDSFQFDMTSARRCWLLRCASFRASRFPDKSGEPPSTHGLGWPVNPFFQY